MIRTAITQNELSETFQVEKRWFDYNYEVAVNLDIFGVETSWNLLLSLVGPYALLLRQKSENIISVIEGPSSDEEGLIFSIVANNQIEILPKSIVSMPSKLNLELAEPGEVNLYQALFEDIAELPWEYKACDGYSV